MPNIAAESFTGTGGTELSAHDAAWSKITGVTGNLLINTVDSVTLIAQSSVNCAYTHSATPPDANYSVSLDVSRTGVTMGHFGVIGRASTSVQTFYNARINNGNAELYKFVSGTATLLGSAASQVANGETKTIALIMDGDQISMQVAGSTVVGPVTDTAITAAGKAGIRANAPGNVYVDNWTADTLGGGGGGGVPIKAFRIIHG